VWRWLLLLGIPSAFVLFPYCFVGVQIGCNIDAVSALLWAIGEILIAMMTAWVGNERISWHYVIELTGIARLKEALEANDWASIEDDFGIDDFGDLEDEESMGFGAEAAELEMEMFGMKRAIYGIGKEDEDRAGKGVGRGEDEEEDEEDEVEKLEALMLRMQVVRGEFASWAGSVD